MSAASLRTAMSRWRRLSRLRFAFSVTVAGTIGGCGGDESQAPPAVATVALTPSRATIEAGETLRLRAVAADDAGNPMADREMLWSTDRPDIAMVSQRGDVTGVSPGTATISATVDGKRGTARVTVESRKATVTIAAVSPDPLVEGQSASITGQGFDPVPANNRVTVDGTAATVTEASATRLTITVPAADCRPARTVDVRVTTSADPQGRTINHPIRPSASVNVAVGRLAIIRDPARFCLQFGPSAAAEAYLVGVQSTSESVKSVTTVNVQGVSTAAASVVDPPLAAEYVTGRQGLPMSAATARDDEITRGHLTAEVGLRERQQHLFAQLGRTDRAAMRSAPNAAVAGTFPSSLKVGDVVNMRMPSWASPCADYTPIRAVVRVIGTRAIWLEDVANPAGGYGAAELQAFSRLFDERLYESDVEYFGSPTDLDQNGRIAIVITKEVNRIQLGQTYLLGFVAPADLVSRNTCASSNEGEVFYGRTPDAAGALGYKIGIADLVRRAPGNIAHEVVHIIQFGHRIYGSQDGNVILQSTWESEGQATLGEEVAAFRVEGRTPGRNYGGDVVAPLGGGVNWYPPIVDKLGIYYGWDPGKPRIPNAPEQCSWLDAISRGNAGPCYASDLLPYGVGWLFLRWLSDQYGPAFPGGEKGLQRALVDLKGEGLGVVAGLVGVPSDSLLAMFAAMQYVDDRVPNADPRLTLTSWNLPSVLSRSEDQLLLPRERPFGAFSDALSVRGASTAYYRVSGAQRSGMAIRVRGGDGAVLPAHMRLWVVRLK